MAEEKKDSPEMLPTLTTRQVAELPKLDKAPDQDFYPGITARRLTPPNCFGIKTKNPGLSFRWINRASGGGRRVEEHKALGFRVAAPTDCEFPGLQPVNGQFINGDLILMCISKEKYLGALKYNHELAAHLVSRKKHEEVGKQLLNDALDEISAKPELRQKMGVDLIDDKKTAALNQ